jgi:hypothetical protein
VVIGTDCTGSSKYHAIGAMTALSVGLFVISNSIFFSFEEDISIHNCISGVVVSVLTSSMVGRMFEHRIKPKIITLVYFCFSAHHISLRSKSKDGLKQESG